MIDVKISNKSDPTNRDSWPLAEEPDYQISVIHRIVNREIKRKKVLRALIYESLWGPSKCVEEPSETTGKCKCARCACYSYWFDVCVRLYGREKVAEAAALGCY